jgi:ATP-dependent Clp protease adaptor protein ClpS
MLQEQTNPTEYGKRQLTRERELILFNDDHNTFDYVIESLIEICDHDAITAEQLTLIVHFKGKCAVKSGDFDELLPMKKALTLRGLTVSIK